MSGRRTGLLLVLLNILLFSSAELTFDEDGHLLDDGLFKSDKMPDQKKDDRSQSKVKNVDESFALDNKDGEAKASAGERLVKEDDTDRKMKKRADHHHHRHRSVDVEDKDVSFEPASARVLQQPINQGQPDALKSLALQPNKKDAATMTGPEGAGPSPAGLVPTQTDAANPLAKPAPEERAPPKGPDNQAEQAVRSELDLYPWESAECKDDVASACEFFKPLCPIMGRIAYKKCRKTCKVCATDEHEPHVLGAKIVSIGASVILSQKGPTAPTFLTVCVKKDEAAKQGLDKGTHGLVIHSYGEVGQNCQNFGPHYNPFSTSHGHPDDAMKHAGDLGQLSFGNIPEDWPDDVPKCSSDLLLGAYGMFDHVQLYGDVCPSGRPVVLYKGEAPLLEFEKSTAIGCGRLDTLRDETAWPSKQGDVKVEERKMKPTIGQNASLPNEGPTNSVVITGSRVKEEELDEEGKEEDVKDAAESKKPDDAKADKKEDQQADEKDEKADADKASEKEQR